MRKVILILFLMMSVIAFSQNYRQQKEDGVWDQGVPILPSDPYIMNLINGLGGLETLIDIKNQGKQFNNQINNMDPNTSYEPNVSVSSPPKPTKPPV